MSDKDYVNYYNNQDVIPDEIRKPIGLTLLGKAATSAPKRERKPKVISGDLFKEPETPEETQRKDLLRFKRDLMETG